MIRPAATPRPRRDAPTATGAKRAADRTGSAGSGYSRGVRLLFIVDPLDRLALAGDSSYALMLEAAARGWGVWTCQIEHLGLVGDDAVCDAAPTAVKAAARPAEAFQLEPPSLHRLAEFDIVLMRKDPPVDVSYLHATWILEHARGKTLLVNDPRGLRELNEHLAVLRVPAQAEARGNLHVGGRAVKTEITARDREIISAISPFLRSYGQIFVGIDVIGGMLTELNITSPTGVRHISQLDDKNIAGEILDRLARSARHRTSVETAPPHGAGA